MKIKSLNTDDIKVHELASMTPQMTKEQFEALKSSIEDNGQLEPVKLYHGLIVDGRHRLKALKELGIDKILCIEEDPKQSISDIKEKIQRGWEMRRHQTPTQLAIMAMREYLRRKRSGEKVGQGQIAQEFGIPSKQVWRALKLYNLVGSEIIDELFNGAKINISDTNIPRTTDSLATLIIFFQKNKNDLVNSSKEIQTLNNIEDERKMLVEEKYDEIKNLFNNYEIEYMRHLLNSHIEFNNV